MKYEENEDTVMWRKIKEERQARHAEMRVKNLEILNKSGLSFRAGNEECMVFRSEFLAMADFYPSTGRWRDIKTGRTFSGGAKAFIRWYKNPN